MNRSKTLLSLAFLLLATPIPRGQEPVSQEDLEAWTANILKEIEAFREAKFPRDVSVSVADVAEFKSYMDVRIAKTMTPERIAADETVAKLLGLIPADMDYLGTMSELLEAQVGGFYDPDTEGFFLMEQFGGTLAKSILAHELTHALDDQLHDIDGTLEKLEGNADAEFAYHAVVEGSGTAVMNAWTMKHIGEFSGEDMAASREGMAALEDAPPFFWKPLLGVYMRGAAFLNRSSSVLKGQMSMPELADFTTAFTAPPRSSEQVLHPEKYWDEDRRDEPIGVSFDRSNLPEGWEILHEDTFGEFMWGMVIEPLDDRGGIQGELAVLGAKYTYPATEGWGGDRYAFLGRGDERVLCCETVWDTAADAVEFDAVIEGLAEHFRAAAEATAAVRGLESGGFELLSGPTETRRALLVRVGTSAEEARALRDSLAAAIQPPAER